MPTADVLVLAHGGELEMGRGLALALDIYLRGVQLGQERFGDSAHDDGLGGVEGLGVVVLAYRTHGEDQDGQGQGKELHGASAP